MKNRSIFDSIHISLPFGRIFLESVLYLVCFLLITEGVVRSGVYLNLWREPLLGSINAELDMKLQILDEIVEVRSIDCIILGSSQTDTALNPEVFSDEYKKLTGDRISCFNFGIGTLTAGPAGAITGIIIERYKPKFLIQGISARDFSRDFGELSREFREDPWIRYSLGEFNIAGWLSENSFAFRLLSQMRTWFNPDYQDFRTGLLRVIQPDGYLLRSGNDIAVDEAPSIPKFKLYREDLAGLNEVLALDDPDGTRVIFLEIPVHNQFLVRYVENDQDKYYIFFRDPIDEIIAQEEIPFFHSQETMAKQIPDYGWYDVLHMNIQGSEIFSRWFVREAITKLRKAIHSDSNK